MAWCKKHGKYYYDPEDAQLIKQKAKAEAEIKNENENEAETEQAQIEQNIARVTQRAECLNVNGGGPGQNALVDQTTGSDVLTADTAQTATQTTDNLAVAAAVPVNTGDQTIND